MKIAISGATGFVGRHITIELEKNLITPILLVRPSSIALSTNIKHTVVPINLECIDNGKNLFERIGKPEILIHCAWSGLPNYTSFHHFEKELYNQYTFLTQLIKGGLKNILVTGTCFEYGMQSGALCEKMESKPINPYGFAKYSLFQQLKYFQTSLPFNLTWGRLFYLYGEGQSKNSLLSQLKQAVSNQEQLFNMSGGEQLRDYLSISKAAEYLVSLALLKQNIGILNICSGKPMSVRSIVENWIVENNWNIKLNLGYYPYPDYEPMAFWGDRNKLDKYLSKGSI